MAQHGYLREYDEAPDSDRWRDEDRERGWNERDRGWRGDVQGWNERNHGSRGGAGDWNERNRDFMLGDRDRNWERDRGSDRDRQGGFLERMGDHARSWFSDDDDDRQNAGGHRGMSHYGHKHGYGGFQGDFSRGGSQQGGRGDWERAPRNVSAHQDDHYRSWRDKQMEALDRDYQDYCREREQQFHQDFDSWRSNRQNQGSGGQQQGDSSSDTMELNNPTELSGEAQSTSSPIADATLGTNNSENSNIGRGRR